MNQIKKDDHVVAFQFNEVWYHAFKKAHLV